MDIVVAAAIPPVQRIAENQIRDWLRGAGTPTPQPPHPCFSLFPVCFAIYDILTKQDGNQALQSTGCGEQH
jgi:hypothetical protein